MAEPKHPPLLLPPPLLPSSSLLPSRLPSSLGPWLPRGFREQLEQMKADPGGVRGAKQGAGPGLPGFLDAKDYSLGSRYLISW